MAEGQKDADGTPAGRSPGKQKSDGAGTPASGGLGRGRKQSRPDVAGAANAKKGRLALGRMQSSGAQSLGGVGGAPS